RLEQADHGFGYAVLQIEQSGCVVVEPLCPELFASRRVGEMRGNSEAAAGAPDATLEHIANADLAHRPPCVDRRIPGSEHPERLAKRCDLDGEVALLHDCAGPSTIEEMILRDDHPPSFQKGIEQ